VDRHGVPAKAEVKKETVRTLVIVLGVLILVAIVGLGSAVWLFTRSFDVGTADAATAALRFDDVRSRFAGSAPVLQVRDEEPVVTRRPPDHKTGPRLTTLRILVWDPEEDKLTRIDLPFWLLRLKSGPIDIASDARMSSSDLGLTVEDLERYGPTLVLDHQGADGDRVLIWTE
jgi:hypothetical protein